MPDSIRPGSDAWLEREIQFHEQTNAKETAVTAIFREVLLLRQMARDTGMSHVRIEAIAYSGTGASLHESAMLARVVRAISLFDEGING